MPPTKSAKTKAPKTKKSKKEESEDEIDQQPPADDRDDQIALLQEQVRLLTIEVKTLRKHVGKISPQPPKPPKTPAKASRASISGKPKEKGCTCKGSCSNKVCGCVKKDLYCMPTCKCSDACQNQEPGSENEDKENNRANNGTEASDSASSPEQNDKQSNGNNSNNSNDANTSNSSNENDDEAEFNPMKPRKQLLRSPVSKSTVSGSKASSKTIKPLSHPALNEIPLPRPPKEEPADELPPPEEINAAEVDWEKHKSELVPCSKCKRQFFPHRLKKHENSCIRV